MSKTISILIVDDEPTLCDVLALYFELENFKVLKANNGLEAIEILKINPEIKFVISDVRMPNGDGLYLLKYIKANCNSEMKVVMLSGFPGDLEKEILELGALALFPKPTEPRLLVNFVNSQLSLK